MEAKKKDDIMRNNICKFYKLFRVYPPQDTLLITKGKTVIL